MKKTKEDLKKKRRLEEEDSTQKVVTDGYKR